MWTCPTCGRIFERTGQNHSCKKFPIENHFKNKAFARDLFKKLVAHIETKVGPCKIISLSCCIHLFGKYDFLAVLPKKDKLEVRIALDREIKNKRIFVTVPLSSKTFKNCLYIYNEEEIDDQFMNWVKESYELKG